MRKFFGSLGALGAGALAMYYFDPQLGRERRAAFAALFAGGLPRRRAPLAMQLSADPEGDAALRAEITTRLGRLVSHPRAIDVRVENGVVRLSGEVLAAERDGLLLHVQQLPGVQQLVNAMTAHDTPRSMASLEAAREEAAA